MLILSRVPGEAIVIGGEVRVEVVEFRPPMVRLRVSRVGRGEGPWPDPDSEPAFPPEPDPGAGIAGNINDFTLVRSAGQSFGVHRTTVSVEQVADGRVMLAVEPPGGVSVFGEEVWDALRRSDPSTAPPPAGPPGRE